VKKIDAGVLGRAMAVGTASGAVTGFLVMCAVLIMVVIRASNGDHVNPNPNMAGFLLAAIVGAVVGVLAGFVAGLLLLLPASWLRRRPLPGRLACAVAGGGALSGPFLVAGFGWDNWLPAPAYWGAVVLVAVGGAVGAWKSRYILAGRETTASAAPVTAPGRAVDRGVA
jgi:hypothetical protein